MKSSTTARHYPCYKRTQTNVFVLKREFLDIKKSKQDDKKTRNYFYRLNSACLDTKIIWIALLVLAQILLFSYELEEY